MLNKYVIYWILIVQGLFSSGFSHADNDRLTDKIFVIYQLSEQYYEWRDVPYKLGGISKKGIDCSGFVQITFSDKFNIQLPRTTKALLYQGVRVNKDDIQTGDLVFFKTAKGTYGYHVGIYVDSGKFLHASARRGVTYSSLDSPYWKEAFWQVRRL